MTEWPATPDPEPPRPPRRLGRAPIAVGVSVGLHAVVLLALLSAAPATLVQREAAIPVVPTVLIDLRPRLTPPPPSPTPAPAPPKPAPPKPKAAKPEPVKAAAKRPKVEVTKPAPRRHIARDVRTRDVQPLPLGDGPTPTASDEVGEGELAGAATAGSGSGDGAGAGGGGGGGGCNMVRRLQDALRKDRLVQAAVAEAHNGKAIRVWNGDWVRHGGQEGEGLAAVREAIMWEVGFAPEACRKEAVRGLVVVSLSDEAGAGRVVLGRGQWRWSDLLFARGARTGG